MIKLSKRLDLIDRALWNGRFEGMIATVVIGVTAWLVYTLTK